MAVPGAGAVGPALGRAETTLNFDSALERVDFDRGCCFRLM